MKRNILRYSIIYFMILCFAASFLLISCGDETVEAPPETDIITDEPTDDPTEEAPELDTPIENEPSNPTPEDKPTDDVVGDVTDIPDVDIPTEDDSSDDVIEEDNSQNIPNEEENKEGANDDVTVDAPTTDNENEAPTEEKPSTDAPTEDEVITNPPSNEEILPELPKPEVNPVVPDNISGDTEEDGKQAAISIAQAAAIGLRSSVSIYCNFTSTAYRYPWDTTPTTQTYTSTGSGVIYTLETNGSAFIVTNFHVVYDSSSDSKNHVSDDIKIYLYGMEYSLYAIPATYVGGSANYDIAVLRVDSSEVLKTAIENGACAPVCVSNSDMLVPGETTLAIGNPTSTTVSGISVTQGIVSVVSEYSEMSAIDNSGTVKFRLIRTDTTVNPGNSGGGLFNAKGELVGIVNSKVTTSSMDNIGHAIPVNVVAAVARNIIDNCYGTECESVRRVTLGLSIGVTAVSTEYDTTQGIITIKETVVASEVETDGLTYGKIFAGDEIKSIRIGERSIDLTKSYQYNDFILNARAGDTIVFTIMRSGIETVVSITVTDDALISC